MSHYLSQDPNCPALRFAQIVLPGKFRTVTIGLDVTIGEDAAVFMVTAWNPRNGVAPGLFVESFAVWNKLYVLSNVGKDQTVLAESRFGLLRKGSEERISWIRQPSGVVVTGDGSVTNAIYDAPEAKIDHIDATTNGLWISIGSGAGWEFKNLNVAYTAVQDANR